MVSTKTSHILKQTIGLKAFSKVKINPPSLTTNYFTFLPLRLFLNLKHDDDDDNDYDELFSRVG